MSVSARSSEPSLGQMVAGVTDQVSSLVKLQLELAQTEIKQQVKEGATGGGMAAAAAVLAFVALLMLSVAAALGLANVMPAWAAFLVVAGVYLLVTGILGFVAVKRFQQVKGPQRAQAAAQETKTMLSEHLARRGPTAPAAPGGV
jgi:cytochrome c biogenesis protein CcdA